MTISQCGFSMVAGLAVMMLALGLPQGSLGLLRFPGQQEECVPVKTCVESCLPPYQCNSCAPPNQIGVNASCGPAPPRPNGGNIAVPRSGKGVHQLPTPDPIPVAWTNSSTFPVACPANWNCLFYVQLQDSDVFLDTPTPKAYLITINRTATAADVLIYCPRSTAAGVLKKLGTTVEVSWPMIPIGDRVVSVSPSATSTARDSVTLVDPKPMVVTYAFAWTVMSPGQETSTDAAHRRGKL